MSCCCRWIYHWLLAQIICLLIVLFDSTEAVFSLNSFFWWIEFIYFLFFFLLLLLLFFFFFGTLFSVFWFVEFYLYCENLDLNCEIFSIYLVSVLNLFIHQMKENNWNSFMLQLCIYRVERYFFVINGNFCVVIHCLVKYIYTRVVIIHIFFFSSNASIFLDFGYDSNLMLYLFEFLGKMKYMDLK